jgi:hypothetical protein
MQFITTEHTEHTEKSYPCEGGSQIISYDPPLLVANTQRVNAKQNGIDCFIPYVPCIPWYELFPG